MISLGRFALMTISTTNLSPPPSDALRRDLALVLPHLAMAPSVTTTPDNLNHAADHIARSRAPAIVGLSNLSIEAIREAILLAERMRGRLLPFPTIGHRITATQPVTESASLGHLFACEMIVWVGCNGASGPIAERIAERQPLASFVDASLEVVLRLRGEWRINPVAEPIGKFKRVAAVLAPDCDPRVAGQWHKLAAQVQERARLCVFSLPDAEHGGNSRGVAETITWQTGVSPIGGGVDFSDGSPRWCPPAEELLKRGAIDLALATSPGVPVPGNIQQITIDGTATRGTAARVMRCDGVVLWLCDDPATAPPDPAAAFFAALAEKIEARA